MDPDKAMLYALSIGFNENPSNKKQLRFTYELAEDFGVFPTFVTGIPINDLGEFLVKCPGLPDFNFMSLLHGEENLEFHKHIPTNEILEYQLEIVDIDGKAKGTVVCIGVKIFTKENNTLLATIYINLFIRGLKGEGAKSSGILKSQFQKVPESTPLKEVTVKTYPNQALFYRLGGNDKNPLHVDYEMAAIGGFDSPILHGLCSFGIVGKAAYELFCDDKLENFLNYKARFTSHVFPGESLNIQFWKGNGSSIIVSAKTVERKKQILLGEITLKNAKF